MLASYFSGKIKMPTTSALTLTNQQLRLAIRKQRAALPPHEQQHLSHKATRHLSGRALFRNARYIALYLPVKGEADPTFLRKLTHPRQQIYLPVLSPFGGARLWFVLWNEHTRFRLNRFQIPEPLPHWRYSRPARWIDLVITPLVAVDKHGSRLGMGGGFYDRTFSFKRIPANNSRRPYLCGFAYAFQQVESLPQQPWDVPLDAVTSDCGFFQFNTRLY
ncbi:5-formyltetrahydrofolate cyclo-ligase [Candidatus Thiothrix sp. Deng01]|uniref:5-formyltetrahydrofolate cyclo-ligase n=1 Tax=Candidatus Thiothrix phosphatis TaxID=3112415 RepID=A0ABU6D3D5_9GAMM|nr:5-formyltetrahydrofolate cyclo-ligase [Candidatus Thiothrix sp. Deng01]MEB4593611.1 5-formyltetrahydrofolate cyclo-ligase [Candidatus Thiothrix sp. Deng01]